MSGTEASIPDNKLYDSVSFRVETLRIYVQALKYYKGLLQQGFESLKQQEFFRYLFDEPAIERSPFGRELARVERLLTTIQKAIDDPGWPQGSPSGRSVDFPFRDIPIRHGTVRSLKSVVALYVGYLRGSRDAFVRDHPTSSTVLQAIDAEIARAAESASGGVFEQAEPVPLFAPFAERPVKHTAPREKPSRADARPQDSSWVPSPIFGIEVLDSELRERCWGLLEHLVESQDREKYDTVISEATRVLENRLRSLPGMNARSRDPIGEAFGGSAPVVKISDDDSEQQGAYFLFKGVFQFVRNPYHHRIIPVNRERVVQLVGLIDYMLYLLDGAGKGASKSPPVEQAVD